MHKSQPTLATNSNSFEFSFVSIYVSKKRKINIQGEKKEKKKRSRPIPYILNRIIWPWEIKEIPNVSKLLRILYFSFKLILRVILLNLFIKRNHSYWKRFAFRKNFTFQLLFILCNFNYQISKIFHPVNQRSSSR